MKLTKYLWHIVTSWIVILTYLHTVVAENSPNDRNTVDKDTQSNDRTGRMQSDEATHSKSFDSSQNNRSEATAKSSVSNDILLYRRLLKHKRQAQKDAIQSILSLETLEKQHKMISMVLERLFEVLTKSKVHLTEAAFIPGDPFPTDESVKNALSIVVENFLFLGDILLRLPDITHNLLKPNPEWNILLRWGIGFCNDTRILEGSDVTLLNTMAQELELVEKDANYINPYRADTIKANLAAGQRDTKVDEEALRIAKKAEKARLRAEKKKQRGPRMSSMRDEL